MLTSPSSVPADNLLMVRFRAVHATLVALAVLALGASAAAQSAPSSSARAFGVRVLLPDGTVASSAPVSSPPRSSATVDGWTYGEGAVASGGTAARQNAFGSSVYSRPLTETAWLMSSPGLRWL